MIIYIVCEEGLNKSVLIHGVYKNKGKAIKKAKLLMQQMKDKKLYIDCKVRNKKNPFKKNNCVNFYRNEEGHEKESATSSVILEKTRLIA